LRRKDRLDDCASFGRVLTCVALPRLIEEKAGTVSSPKLFDVIIAHLAKIAVNR
jgi:hypothetical protein